MSVAAKVKALEEEVARLKARVAWLEARPTLVPYCPIPVFPVVPTYPAYPHITWGSANIEPGTILALYS